MALKMPQATSNLMIFKEEEYYIENSRSMLRLSIRLHIWAVSWPMSFAFTKNLTTAISTHQILTNTTAS